MTSATIMQLKPSETVVSACNARPKASVDRVQDLAHSIQTHGQLQPIIVRKEGEAFAVVAGQRRRAAGLLLADKDASFRLNAIELTLNDDQALALSIAENRETDAMSAYELSVAFNLLVKQGWTVKDVADSYRMSELQVRQHCAIGRLPKTVLRAAAKGDIDDDALRFLAICPAVKVKQWMAAYRTGDYPSSVWQLKRVLTGGDKLIETSVALFDVEDSGLATISDLFGGNTYFADAAAFWEKQQEAANNHIDVLREKGWEVEVLDGWFHAYEYEKTSKQDGGKVFIENDGGIVKFHKGYVSKESLRKKAAASADRGTVEASEKAEVTQKMNEYLRGYMTKAVQAEVASDGELALRVALLLLIGNGGTVAEYHSTDLERIDEQLSAGELGSSPAALILAEHADVAAGYLGDHLKSRFGGNETDLVNLVMAMDIRDVQAVIGSVVAARLTPDSLSMALYQQVSPKMADYWSANRDGAFFNHVSNKKWLLSILASLDAEKAAEVESQKVALVREALLQAASSETDWLPAYFQGEHYMNGKGKPF